VFVPDVAGTAIIAEPGACGLHGFAAALTIAAIREVTVGGGGKVAQGGTGKGVVVGVAAHFTDAVPSHTGVPFKPQPE